MWNRLILISLLTISVYIGNAQTTDDTLSLNFRDLPLELVLDSITYKTGYFFSYNADILPPGSLYTLKRSRIHIDKILKELLVGTNLDFIRHEDQIVIKIKAEAENSLTKSGNAQYVQISGWVRDMQTKEPLVGVNVYLNGTTIGAVTDQYGNYVIAHIPRDNYTLVFSLVGYELVAYNLITEKSSNFIVNCLMYEKVLTLDQIEIKSSPLLTDQDWMKYYRIFKNQFIGTSAFASRCTILNPEVLNFSKSESEDVYNAYAEEPIIMENLALGYKVFIELQEYEGTSETARYHVVARFEQLAPSNRRVAKRWKANRLRSYNGSQFHFMKSLVNQNLDRDGFVIHLLDDMYASSGYETQVKEEHVLKIGEKGSKYLSFNGVLKVVYTKETEPLDYIESKQNNTSFILPNRTGSVTNLATYAQTTYIELKASKVLINRSGQIESPEDLIYYGYWSWERMAELMPVNYNYRNDKL